MCFRKKDGDRMESNGIRRDENKGKKSKEEMYKRIQYGDGGRRDEEIPEGK